MENENSVIKCDSVYKIFGTNAEKMLEDNKENVDPKVLKNHFYHVLLG